MKQCRACRKRFEPATSLQVVCSPNCAIDYARTDKGKANRRRVERSETRKARSNIKTLAEYRAEAQRALNAYIRARDKDQPCISCGRYHQGQWHAGHYRTVGACPELRFDEMNIHKQCAPCNNHLSGNIVEYRKGLIARYGQEVVDYIEGPHPVRKWTKDDLIKIKLEYRQLTREIENE